MHVQGVGRIPCEHFISALPGARDYAGAPGAGPGPGDGPDPPRLSVPVTFRRHMSTCADDLSHAPAQAAGSEWRDLRICHI